MLDLTRPNAKRQRAKRAVRARVTIATHDRHAGLRETKLGTNHVNDALLRRVNIEELNAKFPAVSAQRFDLLRSRGIRDGQTAIGGRNVVIDGAKSKIGTSYFSARLA
jgi:hypothetical protein